MLSDILTALPNDHPWRRQLRWYETLGSTNDLAQEAAAHGAPDGTVIVAGQQTDGHGRLTRSFSSPAGLGLYLSCILRPNCPPQQLMHLTCAVAVAAAQAVSDVCGITPGIKWTNDLVLGEKKLGGILTSLRIDPQNGSVDAAILGIGINCLQRREDFPPALREMACSLAMHDHAVVPETLAAALTVRLHEMSQCLLCEKERLMRRYRALCITPGRQVSWQVGDRLEHGLALDLDPDGGLLVRLSDGRMQTITFGEVSVRGMYGYL